MIAFCSSLSHHRQAKLLEGIVKQSRGTSSRVSVGADTSTQNNKATRLQPRHIFKVFPCFVTERIPDRMFRIRLRILHPFPFLW